MIRKIGQTIERICIVVLVVVVRLYQLTISPLLGPACRLEPTCSRYLIEAVQKYGLFSGFRKGLCRFLRCHPWHPGGYDPP
jgi:putative membrane protein insertion efficiency factor